MTFTLRESSSAVAAPARASLPAADPWDAPYFGGRVYFSYYPILYATLRIPPAPALPSAAITDTASSTAPALAEQEQAHAPSQGPAPLGLDPWDAPYFGGAVYFRYPAFPVAVAALASPAAQLNRVSAAPSGIPAPDPDSPVSPAPPDPPVAPETAGPPAATPAATPAAIPVPTPRRRGWLARLFRAG